jgi:hypothetical protein
VGPVCWLHTHSSTIGTAVGVPLAILALVGAVAAFTVHKRRKAAERTLMLQHRLGYDAALVPEAKRTALFDRFQNIRGGGAAHGGML